MTGNDENETTNDNKCDDRRHRKYYWYRHVGGGPCDKTYVLIAYEYKTLFKPSQNMD